MNNNNNFIVPNMGGNIVNEGMQVGLNDGSVMANIIRNLNESVDNESVQICPVCGASFDYDNTNSDGSSPCCPVCSYQFPNNAQQFTDVTIDPEVNESVEVEALEGTLNEYMSLIGTGDYAGAKTLLESVEATAICNGDQEVLLEKIVVHVNAAGQKIKKKVKTKKVKRTSAQKAALAKARKRSHTTGAKKARKKALKARARLGLNESMRKKAICESVNKFLVNEGISTVNRSALTRVINEAYHINEATCITDTDSALSELTHILNTKGLEVLNSDVGTQDGVIAVSVTVRDTDTEVFLGEISDELSASLGCEVDYDEPEEDEDDESLVDLAFYVIPDSEDLSENQNIEPVVATNENVNKGGAIANECTDNSKNIKKKINESVQAKADAEALNESFDLYAGGAENVRCRINPAFIKEGQIIFDADQHTVFKAISASSVLNESCSNVTIDVLNSEDTELAGVTGSEVEIASKGNYFLLKANPVE